MPRLTARLAAGILAAGLLAGAASAAPAVNVTVGGDLAKNTRQYGQRDVDQVRTWLKEATERALSRPNAVQVKQVDLVLEKAVPNRPTFAQMSRTPGLSIHSVGLGGARISGTVTAADGSVKPIRFQWFETDLRQEVGATTWSDAERAFGMLADKIAKGQPADRYGPGSGADGRFGARNTLDD